MARTKVFKRPWLCRHNHPMWRKPVSGHWICHTCNDMNLNGASKEFGVCIHGHKREIGIDCKTCKAYTNTPWLKELDATGKTTCPNGHEVSHYDDSLMYVKHKNSKRRLCRKCTGEQVSKIRKLTPDFTKNPMCRKGLHPRTEEYTKRINGKRQCRPCWEKAQEDYTERAARAREKKSGLRPSHVDWVVVERMLAKGTTDYIRRGRHVGPTDGERWVAYCTFVKNAGGRHPEDLYGEPGYDAMQLWKFSAWKGLGKKYKWREFSLSDLRNIISEPEYVTGGFLLRYKGR